jgi:hypothetical protein
MRRNRRRTTMSREDVLLAAHDVVLTSTHLVVGGRTFMLAELNAAVASRLAPRWKWKLLTMGLGVCAVPVVLAFNRATPEDWAWLLLFPVVLLFWGIWSLLTDEGRSALVVSTATGPIVTFTSRDHEFVARLVTRIQERLRPMSTNPPAVGNH